MVHVRQGIASMISIVLPFRNASRTINSCLTSISSQSFRRFEILAIDDHSEDSSRAQVAAWPDYRLRLLTNPGKGLVNALNFGLAQARFPLVARMDADDLMRSTRLACQAAMFSSQPRLTLAGCRVALFPAHLLGEGYREYVRWQNSLVTPQSLVNQRFVESTLAHPGVMFRRDAILEEGGYRAGDFPEDYELWLRLAERGHLLAKHPDILLDWRESPARLSRTSPAYDRVAFDKLRANYLSRLPVLQSRPVAFWGAGRKTRMRTRHLIERGVQPWRWLDIDPKKVGNSLQGVPVEYPEVLARPHPIKPFVLNYVTNHGARDLIAVELDALGYREGTDFLSVG